MKVIYVRDSASRGYLRIGLSEDLEKYEYTVSLAQYEALGSPLCDEEFFELEAAKEYDMKYHATLHALKILSYGDNNIRTLRDKLLSRSVSSAVADEVCEEMVRLGYVDEHRQLERLIENEVSVKLSGRRKLYAKLIRKGYSKKDIDTVLEDLISRGTVDFTRSKERLIEKKLQQGASEEEKKALLYKYGYPTD